MKYILAILLLIISPLSSADIFLAKSDKGYIALYQTACPTAKDKLAAAAIMSDGATSTGCWTINQPFVVIRYDNKWLDLYLSYYNVPMD